MSDLEDSGRKQDWIAKFPNPKPPPKCPRCGKETTMPFHTCSAPIAISTEAREAAICECLAVSERGVPLLAKPEGYFVQQLINQATEKLTTQVNDLLDNGRKLLDENEKLTKENEELKWHIAGHPQTTAPHGQLAPSCDICNTAHDGISLMVKENHTLTTRIKELEEGG